MSAALIRRKGAQRNVRRDKNGETFIKGKRQPDLRKTICVFASIQPLKPNEIIEESNERNTQGIRIYSFDELRTVNTKTQFKADIVEYLGDDYEVMKVDPWQDNRQRLVHYKSMAFKVNPARSK